MMLNDLAAKDSAMLAQKLAGNFSLYGYSVAEKQNGVKLALDDLIAGLSRARLWLLLALLDIRIRYHRTIFGPVWILLSFSIFLFVKAYIFTSMSGAQENVFIPHLTLGFCVWLYISGAMGDGVRAFIQNRSWIMGVKTPYSLFVYSSLSFAFFNFVICLIPSYAVSAIYMPFSAGQLGLSLIGVALLTYCLYWISFSLALISVFLRDLVPLVGTIMRIFFFLTPILWLPETIGGNKAAFLLWNPFYHLLEVVRAPIMSGEIPAVHLYVTLALAITLQTVSIALFSALRRWVPSYL